MTNRLLWSIAAVSCLAACGGAKDDPARARLTELLADSLGKEAQPAASFLKDRSHLQIDVGSKTFSDLSGFARAAKAREIAELSLRNYSHRSEVDSVRVQGREPEGRGLQRIFWAYDFAVKDLKTPPKTGP